MGSLLINNSSSLHMLTGVSLSRFSDTLISLEALDKRDKINPPERAPGGGRHKKLNIASQLLLSLIYNYVGTKHEDLGKLFNIDNSNVSRYNKRICNWLEELEFKFPEQNQELTFERVQELFKSLERTGHYVAVKELVD